jgi:crotonobetainyl-CoA:carnitine CoA-transferase CaiB-like acyl-CoA transferase
MLAAYRVLDLTNERGLLCGQILADLGADVIQVEPPTGSSARRLPPFAKDEPDPERSLVWWAYARNKRGIALDWEDPRGRELLRRLAASADVLVESEAPGRLAALGLGYEDLARVNERLVVVSITPFGQHGPKRDWAETDLVLWASAGPLYLSGDADRPPLRPSVPQAWAHACADAAVAALVALAERRRSGRGQHVDVSAQQSVSIVTLAANLSTQLRAPLPTRSSGVLKIGNVIVRTVYRARDGWVLHVPGLTPAVGSFMKRMVDWMLEQRLCDAKLRDEDFGAWGIRMFLGQLPQSEWDPVDAALAELFGRFEKADLLREAVARKLLVAPILDPGELARSEQLAARQWPVSLEHPDLGAAVPYPGPFAHFERSPIRYRRRAPRLGEHGREVLVEELGVPAEEFEALRARGVVA